MSAIPRQLLNHGIDRLLSKIMCDQAKCNVVLIMAITQSLISQNSVKANKQARERVPRSAIFIWMFAILNAFCINRNLGHNIPLGFSCRHINQSDEQRLSVNSNDRVPESCPLWVREDNNNTLALVITIFPTM